MSNYPTSVDDASSLYTPADAFTSKPLRSTLAVSCQPNDTTLQFSDGVLNVGGPAAYGVVRIDDEQIFYTAAAAGTVTGCTRGFGGTARIGHSAGAVVRWPYVAAFDLALQAAIIAIQNTVGVTGVYNFAPTPAVRAQTGTTYTILDSDRGKLVTGTNASAQAYTLPQAGAASAFLSGWFFDIENRGAGTLTITPTTSTIDGAATLALTANQGCRIFSDGANYFTQRGIGGSASSSLAWVVGSQLIGPVDITSSSYTAALSFTLPANTLGHDGDAVRIKEAYYYSAPSASTGIYSLEILLVRSASGSLFVTNQGFQGDNGTSNIPLVFVNLAIPGAANGEGFTFTGLDFTTDNIVSVQAKVQVTGGNSVLTAAVFWGSTALTVTPDGATIFGVTSGAKFRFHSAEIAHSAR